MGRTKYNENKILDRIEFIPIIGNLRKNRTLQIHDILNIQSELPTI